MFTSSALRLDHPPEWLSNTAGDLNISEWESLSEPPLHVNYAVLIVRLHSCNKPCGLIFGHHKVGKPPLISKVQVSHYL